MPLKNISFLSGKSGNFLPLFDVPKKTPGAKAPAFFSRSQGDALNRGRSNQ